MKYIAFCNDGIWVWSLVLLYRTFPFQKYIFFFFFAKPSILWRRPTTFYHLTWRKEYIRLFFFLFLVKNDSIETIIHY